MSHMDRLTLADKFVRAYCEWLIREDIEPSHAAIVKFHSLPECPMHSPCNFCH